MKKFLIINGGLLTVSLFTVVITSFSFSHFYLIQAIILLLFIFLVIINSLYIQVVRKFIWGKGMWLLFFLSSFLVQFIIVVSGSWSSPFFILFHLLTLAISFLFTFSTAIYFVVYSIFVIGSVAMMSSTNIALINEDPIRFILSIISLLAILPLTSILASQYKQKDQESKFLEQEVRIEEDILSGISELVFITDESLGILSVNDAVSRTLHRSAAEITSKNLFEILFLKDADGNAITKDAIFTESLMKDFSPIIIPQAILLTTSSLAKKVSIKITPIRNIKKQVSQLSIIISDYTQAQPQQRLTDTMSLLEEARQKQEARIHEIKKKLSTNDLMDIKNQITMHAKIDQDILYTQALQMGAIEKKTTSIDMAKMCKRLIDSEKEIAQLFNTQLSFTIRHFTKEDIAQYVPKDYPIDLEDVTAPFFTVFHDVKYISFLIQKLLDISILVAGEKKEVTVTIDRDQANKNIILKINFPSPIAKDHIPELFLPYYGNLGINTHLFLGSGLEGYIAKSIADSLSIPLEIDSNKKGMEFTLTIGK